MNITPTEGTTVNNSRRKDISEIRATLDQINLGDIFADVESLKDEEQDYYDNMPEGLQGSERGEIAEAAVSALEEAMDALESAKDSVEAAMQALEEATA